MSDVIISKERIQKKLKIDSPLWESLLKEGNLEDKESFSDVEFESLRLLKRQFPYSKDAVCRKYKTDTGLMNKLISQNFLPDRQFYSEKELGVFQSFYKLKRLGYTEEACLKVLREVGIPEDENLAEDSRFIQLKDLAEKTGLTERTIKFYEKDNLVEAPRIYKNKRFYETTVIVHLEFIRDMQHVGYKLSEIKEWLLQVKSRDEDTKEKAAIRLKKELEEKKLILKDILNKVNKL